MKRMLGKVRWTIEKYSMLRKGDRVVVAVSGGPDSVALVDLLCSLRDEYGLSLWIAHLDHGIRGQDSKDDALFVRDLGKALGLEVVVHEIDVPSLAESEGLSLENGARTARYQFLSEVASDLEAKKVATGHTADDQAETVLMRIIRGSGMGGLGGMAPVREFEDSVEMIRPMIEVWRKDVERYLRERKLDFRQDRSNWDSSIPRNKVRLNLIPYLAEGYNPKIKDVLVRLGEILRCDYDYLGQAIESAFLDLAKIKNDSDPFLKRVVLSARRINQCHLAVRRGILRRSIREVKGDLKRIAFKNWEDLDDLIGRPGGNFSLDLADGLKVERSYDKLIIHRRDSSPEPKAFRYRLKVPGSAEIPEAGVKIQTDVLSASCASNTKRRIQNAEFRPQNERRRRPSIELFDYDKLKFPITIRTRRPGDRIRPIGMKGSKKVKNLFIDEKIPLAERDSIPLATTAGGEVIWVLGLRMAEQFKLTSRTKRVLRVKVSPLII